MLDMHLQNNILSTYCNIRINKCYKLNGKSNKSLKWLCSENTLHEKINSHTSMGFNKMFRLLIGSEISSYEILCISLLKNVL